MAIASKYPDCVMAVATGKPQRADTVVIADFHAEPAPTRTTIRYDHAA